MGDIKFECSECGKHVAIDEKGAGLRVRCPDCNSELTVPTPQQDTPQSPTLAEPLPGPSPNPLDSDDIETRRTAFLEIKDPGTLVGLLHHARHSDVRAAAARRLADFGSLPESATSHRDEEVREIAEEFRASRARPVRIPEAPQWVAKPKPRAPRAGKPVPAPAPAEDAVPRCPKCGSTRIVERKNKLKATGASWLGALVGGAVLGPLGAIVGSTVGEGMTSMHCNSCNHNW